MSRMRTVLLGVLVAIALALGAAWFFSTHERKQETEKLPPRVGDHNPLYALKLALRAQGQVVASRQRLDMAEMALRPGDTVVLLGDPRTVTPTQWDDLFAFVDAGGHLVLRLPGWQKGVNPAGTLAEWLPIQPLLLPARCLSLRIPGQPDHVEFCRAPRFRLADDARPLAAWRNDQGCMRMRALRRARHGRPGRQPGDARQPQPARRPHQVFARQLLAPGWGAGRYHLVYAADMPPLWRWLLDRAWMALLPSRWPCWPWLWMRSQRFGPLLASPRPRAAPARTRAGQRRAPAALRAFRHPARRHARRRAGPPALARPAGRRAGRRCARATLVAQRSGLGVREVRAALDTAPARQARIPRTHRPPDRPEDTPRPPTPTNLPCPDGADALAAAIRAEVGKAFIGQEDVLDAVMIALLAGGRCCWRACPASARRCWCALSQALGCARARAVHPRPDAQRHQRACGVRSQAGTLRDPPRAGVHQPAAGRRDQPRAGQDPVGAAGGDAGAAGHHRGQQLPVAAAVHVPGDAEPAGTGAPIRCPRRNWTVSC